MEPLTTVGLVANIVQLINAAANAYKVCHEIYELGSSFEDSQMSYTTSQLHRTYSSLDRSLQSSANIQDNNLGYDNDLNELASQCCKTARDLQAMLDLLRKSPGGGIRESSSKPVKKKVTPKEITRIKSRLDELQKALDSKILINLRHGFLGMHVPRHQLLISSSGKALGVWIRDRPGNKQT